MAHRRGNALFVAPLLASVSLPRGVPEAARHDGRLGACARRGAPPRARTPAAPPPAPAAPGRRPPRPRRTRRHPPRPQPRRPRPGAAAARASSRTTPTSRTSTSTSTSTISVPRPPRSSTPTPPGSRPTAQPRADRRALRRARHQRVQPGAGRAPREVDDELPRRPGRGRRAGSRSSPTARSGLSAPRRPRPAGRRTAARTSS